ncbi:hypothetical protein D3C71_854640 [compost metagenome]
MTITRITDLQHRLARPGRSAGQCAVHAGNDLPARCDRIEQAHRLQDCQPRRLQHETRADRLRRCHLVVDHDFCATPGEHGCERQPADAGTGDCDFQPIDLHDRFPSVTFTRSAQLPFDGFGCLPQVFHSLERCSLKALA